MEKIKIFSNVIDDAGGEPMEKYVNGWLEKHPNISVIARTVNTCVGVNELGKSFINITIAIFYTEKAGG